MKVTLGELKTGECGRVAAFLDAGSSYRRKLLAMGLTPGTRFTVCRVAPLGDPIQLEVRGFQLTIRRDEAAVVEVSRV
ncbi:FeoA family protein [Endozoicomonas elysicola]|uniref:Iron transporter FeoA n=1 Tax=Endozoicomonas elysicola TaxID=305900 RepID=A0A081KCE8_9GAMM|nr:FeoA family protein [Endozoicomonas elysicola]KEI71824.1 iron transporter FeoA [Endozoicomonas elysicola]